MNITVNCHTPEDFAAHACTQEETGRRVLCLRGPVCGEVAILLDEWGFIRIREAIDRYFGDEPPKAAEPKPDFEPVYFVGVEAKEAEAATT